MDDVYFLLTEYSHLVIQVYNMKEMKITENKENGFCMNITGIMKKTGATKEEMFTELDMIANEKIKNIFDLTVSTPQNAMANKIYFFNFLFKKSYMTKFITGLKAFEINSATHSSLSDDRIFEFKNGDFSKHIYDFKNDRKVIFDYSSPNIAKDIHVGHMRSTFIGDTLSNIFEYLGCNVKRISHIGDFGTQFGLIINYMNENKIDVDNLHGDDLQEIYKNAKHYKYFLSENHVDKDKTGNDFEKKSLEIIKDIQTNPDSIYKNTMDKIIKLSLDNYGKIFDMLNIKQLIMGESFYKPFIPEILDISSKSDIYKIIDGRHVIGKINSIPPLTLVKSLGGYTYGTTDLTAIKYRVDIFGANEIYYVVDTGQSLHFSQLFAVAKHLNLIPSTRVEHVNFGVVLGSDGLRIRSSNGSTPKMIDLINECLSKTQDIFDERGDVLDDNTKTKIAISSLRYANLQISRTADFVFSVDKMIAFKGNTYIYMNYAYARSCQVLNKATDVIDLDVIFNTTDENIISKKDTVINIDRSFTEKDELMIDSLLKFPFHLIMSMNTKCPHHLTTYLYDLVNNFHSYYNQRILNFNKEKDIDMIYVSRLRIIKICQKVFNDIFNILGLDTITHL